MYVCMYVCMYVYLCMCIYVCIGAVGQETVNTRPHLKNLFTPTASAEHSPFIHPPHPSTNQHTADPPTNPTTTPAVVADEAKTSAESRNQANDEMFGVIPTNW